jgi:UDP-N-acetylmuramoyl-L-alanyl-D-glutamate--2,6-diaminopimelate ligase
VKLNELLNGMTLSLPENLGSIDVTSVEEDSRKVSEGSLFVAMEGFSVDGHEYVSDALGKGAAAVLVEKPAGDDPRILLNPLGDNREALGTISARFFDYPWRELLTFGITGTNGKTSTARMLGWILEKNSLKTGIMGTIGHVAGGNEISATMTTPSALETTGMMRLMADSGDRCCVMEVSSHALSLQRVDCIRFDIGLFTNITQDHLDYHASMQDYLRCKLRLFDLLKDDGCGIVGTYSPGYPVIPGTITFGTDEEDDYRVSDINTSLDGIAFNLNHGDWRMEVSVPVPGGFNVFNAAGALAAAIEKGVDPADACCALHDFPGVPGRFQSVALGQDFLVAVDYAHTPDALRRILQQASQLTENRVIAVFGAGGDRDSAKRPIMGGIAQSIADLVLVTSDNPRTEDPDSIIDDILSGIPPDAMSRVTVEPDRRRAIFRAIQMAEDGDVVIIAGKGHEDYQILGREKVHFDDREEAALALKKVLE